MMQRPLRVGIIGCGLIGNKRAAVIKSDPSSVLCAASDVNVINATGMLQIFGGGAGRHGYRNWQEMMKKEELDAVVVATPNKYLKKISLWAMQRGMHVLCEKPFGLNTRESARMVKAARENGVVLKTGFNHRHHPGIKKAKELVDQGAIGPLYFIRCRYGHGGRPGDECEWRADKELCGGGELLDQGVHVVDLFRWFMGDFEEAQGTVQTFFGDMPVEDNAFALFKTKNNQVATMHTSWTQWKNIFSFEVFGEAGYVIVEGLGGSYGAETLRIGKRKLVNGCSQYAGGAPEEETIVFDGPDVSWEMEWKEFISAIRENREPIGSGRDGLEANRMIEAVYRSSKENRPVMLNEVFAEKSRHR